MKKGLTILIIILLLASCSAKAAIDADTCILDKLEYSADFIVDIFVQEESLFIAVDMPLEPIM